MEGTILYSIRTYSVAKKKAITIWKTLPYTIDNIVKPDNFEELSVDADIDDEPFHKVFPDIAQKLDWKVRDEIMHYLENQDIYENAGVTDIAWFTSDLRLGFIVKKFYHLDSRFFVKATDIDELKEKIQHAN